MERNQQDETQGNIPFLITLLILTVAMILGVRNPSQSDESGGEGCHDYRGLGALALVEYVGLSF
jgi:hypothetical protein